MNGKLEVKRSDLVEPFRALAVLTKPTKSENAYISYTDGELTVNMRSGGFVVPAVGEWPIDLRIRARTIHAIALFLPKEEIIHFTADDTRFSCGTMTCDAKWGKQPVRRSRVKTDKTKKPQKKTCIVHLTRKTHNVLKEYSDKLNVDADDLVEKAVKEYLKRFDGCLIFETTDDYVEFHKGKA